MRVGSSSPPVAAVIGCPSRMGVADPDTTLYVTRRSGSAGQQIDTHSRQTPAHTTAAGTGRRHATFDLICPAGRFRDCRLLTSALSALGSHRRLLLAVGDRGGFTA